VKNFSLVYFFSDFGSHGPYTGQVEAIIRQRSDADFVDLLNNAPTSNPYLASYLLNGIYANLPVKIGFLLAVIDPGVGSERGLISLQHEQMTLLAPDNGLLSGVIRRYGIQQVALHARPEKTISDSFHARDWFAPLLCRMINNQNIPSDKLHSDTLVGHDWPTELARVIYIDHYGNLITGLDGANLDSGAVLQVDHSQPIKHARTFSSVGTGELFWYVNSMGLVEIAANSNAANRILNAAIGSSVLILT
jgi:S-adenosylmethionine hydrolase